MVIFNENYRYDFFKNAFIVIQYYLFGWRVATLYKCVGHPCPNTVDCYISRPGEKTVIMLFMYAVAIISTVMNIIELEYLFNLAHDL